MKSCIQLLVLAVIFSSIISSKLKGPEEKLGEGKVCYQSTPNFGGQKGCTDGLECRFKTTPRKGMTGVPKYCLPKVSTSTPIPFAKAVIVEAKLKAGEVCYQSTPDFGGQKKACETGLVCNYKTPPRKGVSGKPMYCIAAPSFLENENENTDELLKENQVCYKSTPDFKNGAKKCAVNLECRYKSDPKGRTGVAKLCLPKSSFLETAISNFI